MSVWDAPRSPSSFQQPVTEFDVDARRRLDGLGPVKPQLSAEEIRVAYEDALREDQAAQDQVVSIENGKAFLAGHPEFINSGANIALMNHELKSKFGIRAYTIAEYENAYASLRASNFLNLNNTVLAAQEKQAAKQRYEEERVRIAAREFDEDVAYGSMSLEEVRQRSNEQLREDFERHGREGGL